jgi:hypothetical protein
MMSTQLSQIAKKAKLDRTDHPDFCQALKDGKLVSDMDVADQLHQRALGFE